MVRLARNAGRGNRGKHPGGRGMGPPPPLMARNCVLPPPRIPPHMPHPRMRPLMRPPPFAPHIPPPLPPPHMRPPPPRLPSVPPVPPMRRNLPFPPGPPVHPRVPMFLHHGPIHRLPPPPPLMRGRGRMHRGMEMGHMPRIRKLGIAPFKSKKGKKPKPAKEKNEGSFYCETCDRAFKTEEQYDEHCNEHVVCGIDGCTVMIHEKILPKHVKLQHESGLYERIAHKTSPEAINAWINERKRNYPTKKNIEERNAQNIEMEQRGERIYSDKTSFSNGGQRKTRDRFANKNERRNKRQSKGTARKQKRSNKLQPFSTIEPEQEDSWRGTLPHFPGIAMSPEVDCNDELEERPEFLNDPEWESDMMDARDKPGLVNPLASVLAALNEAYGSDGESLHSNEEPDALNSEKSNVNIGRSIDPENLKSDSSSKISNVLIAGSGENSVLEDERSSESGPEETAILHTDPNPVATIDVPGDNRNNESEISASNKPKTRTRKRKHSSSKPDTEDEVTKNKFNKRPISYIPARRLTLLQKLLEPEIRHERNIVLQCIRYVVKNDFFNIQS